MKPRKPRTHTVTAYHFVGETLRDGRPIPPDGEWLTEPGTPVLCSHGLHASRHPADALKYAPGSTLCRVKLSGVIVEGDDKLAATSRMIIERIDATSLLREYARWCALQVAHLWDMPDIVRQYLTTGDETIRADAYATANDATAYDAARAAYDAARAAYASIDLITLAERAVSEEKESVTP